MIVRTSGAGDAVTYWLVNSAMGDAKPIGAEYPDVAPLAIGPIQMVDWQAADGLAKRGVLNLPPGRARRGTCR